MTDSQRGLLRVLIREHEPAWLPDFRRDDANALRKFGLLDYFDGKWLVTREGHALYGKDNTTLH